MRDFIDFARAHGVEIDPARFDAGERIRRCGTTLKPKSKNGAYHFDGRRGWVFCWDGEARVQWFDDPNAAPWTDAEKTVWKAKRDAANAASDAGYRTAAARAAELLRTTTPGAHDYLFRKGLPDAQGLVLPDGGLLVPMRSIGSNELQGAQIIRWAANEMRWDKRMLPGMRAKGAVLRLGPKHATETILCEGYATGLSIELAVRQARLNMSVIVCFSDSNLLHVAGLLPRGHRYVFADHDKSGAGQRAAEATGLRYRMSPIEGEDANDLHARAGLMSVAALLMQVRRQP